MVFIFLPINANIVNLIHLPKKEKSINFHNGKLVAPAVMPATSKNGLGLIANIKIVSEPFIFINSVILVFHFDFGIFIDNVKYLFGIITGNTVTLLRTD